MSDPELSSMVKAALRMSLTLNTYMYDKRDLLASVILSYIKNEIKQEDRERQFAEANKLFEIVHMGLTMSYDENSEFKGFKFKLWDYPK